MSNMLGSTNQYDEKERPKPDRSKQRFFGFFRGIVRAFSRVKKEPKFDRGSQEPPLAASVVKPGRAATVDEKQVQITPLAKLKASVAAIDAGQIGGARPASLKEELNQAVNSIPEYKELNLSAHMKALIRFEKRVAFSHALLEDARKVALDLLIKVDAKALVSSDNIKDFADLLGANPKILSELVAENPDRVVELEKAFKSSKAFDSNPSKNNFAKDKVTPSATDIVSNAFSAVRLDMLDKNLRGVGLR